jgi:DNA repair protein RadC
MPRDIIKILSNFSKISENRLHEYLNNYKLITLLEHPETISPTENQLKNLKDLQRLNNIYQRLSNYQEYVFENTTDSIPFLNGEFKNKFDKEHFIVAYLDKGNKLLGSESISTGTLNASIVHPRDVFKQAIKHNADRLILAHNHPSGSPEPSNEDMAITKRLEEVAKTLDKKIIDHIIIGRNDYYSFREHRHIQNAFKIENTNNLNHKKLYNRDLEKNINLLNKFTGITKTELKNIFKNYSINDLFSSPEKILNNKLQIEKIKMLKDLEEKYNTIAEYHNLNSPKITSLDVVQNYIKTKYKNLDNINIALYLDTKNKIIESEVLPKNLSREAEAKYIFEKAILHDSNSFILSTKSDVPIPYKQSNVDRIMYLNNISKSIGIRLLDNIDIDNKKSNSFKQMGVLEDRSKYNISKELQVKETKPFQKRKA